MFVTRLADLLGTADEAHGTKWHSIQLTRASGDFDLVLADTVLEAGFSADLPVLPGRQVRYCIEGEGIVDDATGGDSHRIRPGTAFAFRQGGPCRLRVHTRMRLVSICVPSAKKADHPLW